MAAIANRVAITRRELRSYLRKAVWSLSPVLIADMAKYNGAPPTFLEVLASIPNRLYLSEKDLWATLTDAREETSATWGNGRRPDGQLWRKVGARLAGEPARRYPSEADYFLEAYKQLACRLA